MRYIPVTEEERRRMLKRIGVPVLTELFGDIPAAIRLETLLDLPPAESEWTLMQHIKELAQRNSSHEQVPCFLGAGSYRHFIPAAVPALAGRSEFLTAYTPYQPEISQGSLQAVFEYQTMLTQLTGLPVANASVYDGAMATAESVLMAGRITRRKKVALSGALNPEYRRTVETYCRHQDFELLTIPWTENGTVDMEALQGMAGDGDLAAVVVQSPNFFGVIEDIAPIAEYKTNKTMLITVVSEAVSMGILKPPGAYGADIVCGEAQSLGLPVSYGGPYLGFVTTRETYIRQMPGRLVGMTRDMDGRRGFVNTLSTREQHIRRERATSNICTNQALCAVTAGIYMSLLGRQGLRRLGELNLRKAAYLKMKITALPGYKCLFRGPVFNEFAVSVPGTATALAEMLRNNGIIGGYPLTGTYPELGEAMLLCATETNSKKEMDRLIKLLAKWEETPHE